METLKKINTQLAFYSNSEYKWVRELYIEFQNYFDEKLRPNLSEDFSENEIRQILLFTLDKMYRILSLNDNYWFEDFTQNFQGNFYNLGHPSNKKDSCFIKERVQELFNLMVLPYHFFEMKISQKNVDYYRLKGDQLKLKIAKEQLAKQNEILDEKTQFLDSKIKELRGEYQNKDRTIEVQNTMIVKLRKGIDQDGGIDKLKSLIDKCYKKTAKPFERQEAKQILERIANDLRKKDTYKTLSWSKLGENLGIHHTTAKRWGALLGIKKYC